MKVLSIADAALLKDIAKGYGCALHMHDACGGQAFSIEPPHGTPYDGLYREIEDFLMRRGMQPRYFGDKKLDFTLV